MLGHEKRVLMIGAHPDDEDTELLTVLVRGHGRRDRLPVAQPGRRRTEPDRSGAGRGTGAGAHRGAARRPAAGRRPAILHPGLRLRLLQVAGRDVASLAPGHDPEGRGARHPTVSSPDRHRRLQRHASGRPRPASGRRLGRARGLRRGGRFDSLSRARIPGGPHPLDPAQIVSQHAVRHGGDHGDARGGRPRPLGGLVVSPDRHGRAQSAPVAGHGPDPGPGPLARPAGAGGGSHRRGAATCSPASTPPAVP